MRAIIIYIRRLGASVTAVELITDESRGVSTQNPVQLQLQDVNENIQTEQSQYGTAPDHQRALPAESAGNLLLAAPRDHEGLVVLAFHQHDRRMRIETTVRQRVAVGVLSIPGKSDRNRRRVRSDLRRRTHHAE